MEYRRLGKTGLMVSELCLGTMTFGRELDKESSREIIARFLEAGVYETGLSEEITGRDIKNVRDDVVLATKIRFPMDERPTSASRASTYRFQSTKHHELGFHAQLAEEASEVELALV